MASQYRLKVLNAIPKQISDFNNNNKNNHNKKNNTICNIKQLNKKKISSHLLWGSSTQTDISFQQYQQKQQQQQQQKQHHLQHLAVEQEKKNQLTSTLGFFSTSTLMSVAWGPYCLRARPQFARTSTATRAPAGRMNGLPVDAHSSCSGWMSSNVSICSIRKENKSLRQYGYIPSYYIMKV